MRNRGVLLYSDDELSNIGGSMGMKNQGKPARLAQSISLTLQAKNSFIHQNK
jgi:hypothetical protein